MKTPTAIGLLAGLLLGSHPAQAGEVFRLPGPRAEIWNLCGEVRIEAGEGNAVTVEARRAGPDAARIQPRTGLLEGRETLRFVYPATTITYAIWGPGHQSDARVSADGRFGDITRDHSGRRVRIVGSGGGFEAHVDLVVRVPRGCDVKVHTVAGDCTVSGVDGDVTFDGGAGTVRSARTKGSLTLDIGSGDVAARQHSGRLLIDTGSGSIEVESVKGSLHADTGTGDVRGRDIVVDELSVDTGTGHVAFLGTSMRSASIDTGTGDVSLDLLSAFEDLNIDTGTGQVRLGVPAASGADFSLETGSGTLRCLLATTDLRRSAGSLAGRYGSGRGTLRVETGSGDITIAGARAER